MKKLILFIIIVLFAVGCKKEFVDKFPTQSTVVETYYKTPKDANQALTSVYDMLLQDDWWSSILMSECASDDCSGGAGNTDGGGYTRWDRGLQQPEATANQVLWQIYYGAIYRANVYLEREQKIDWTGKETLRVQYQAEARFLRAYFHFYLARLFGEVPFLDHTPLPTEFPARTPAANLYASIVDDLNFCVAHGLSDSYGAMDPLNWGRATKWSAEAMLGRVFLFYTGYYNQTDLKGTSTAKVAVNFTVANARDAIDDVINSSGHALVDTFAKLWRVPCVSVLGSIKHYAQEINPEVVWSVRFVPGRGVNTFQRMVGPRYTNAGPYGQGWGGMTVMPTLWSAYDPADTRRKATILSWDYEKYTYKYIVNTQANYTGYNSKKYENLAVGGSPEASAFGDWQTNNSEDYMVIRFADVLLMGAELHFNTGDQGTALTDINKVRARAYNGNVTHNFTSLTIDSIFKERRLELACEGLRYFDMLRYCKGDFSKLADLNSPVCLTYTDPNDAANFSADANSSETLYLNVDGNNFVATKGLFQLPQVELDLMKGAIKQNPGYR
jgi:hypothetical protein